MSLIGNREFQPTDTIFPIPQLDMDLPYGVGANQYKDNVGRYTGLEWYYQSARCRFVQNNSKSRANLQTYLDIVNNKMSVNLNVPLCIMEVPRYYYNRDQITTQQIWDSGQNVMKDHLVSDFLLIVKGTVSSATVQDITDNYWQNESIANSVDGSETTYVLNNRQGLSYSGTVQNRTLGTSYRINQFKSTYEISLNGTVQYDIYNTAVKNAFFELNQDERSQSLRYYYTALIPYDYTEYNNQIFANVPIFSVYNWYDMLEYFDTGSTKGSKNQDDLTLSEVNLATDWTVYVRGARRPDIWVTMSSRGLDEFLNSDKNTSGLSANDFKVEYKLPTYRTAKLDFAKSPAFEPLGSIPWNTDIYNNTYGTSYTELVYANYLDNNGYSWLENMYVNDTEVLYYYAELEFRIYYDDTHFSSWCKFHVGFIGSPSLSDFSKMSNYGQVISLNDGSTVTLVYDEYPPDYKPNPDPDIGSDVGDTDPVGTDVGLNLLTTSYVLTNTQVQELGKYIWADDFITAIKQINNSPIENIVGLKVMPCTVDSTPSTITLGNVDIAINGDKVTNVPIINIGSYSFKGYYGNFLDYAPYTQASIFLPFIGFVELDPAQFTGHTLNVKYAFDIINGMCKAMLFADGIYVESHDGKCGVDVPLVASNRSSIESSFISGIATSAMSNDPITGLGSTAIDRILAQKHYSRAGSYSPTLGWSETRKCYLILDIPNAAYPPSYGHDVGYPCMWTYPLSQLSGFTVCGDNIDMSGFTCTEEEKQMIKDALTSGVYL